MQAPSKKIIALIASSVIIVGAIGVNKFWPSKNAMPLISPEYDAAPVVAGATPLSLENAIDGTAFLQSFATSSASTSTDPTPASASRELARAIFANAVYLKSNESLGETEKQALIQDAIANIQNAFSYKEYDAEGLSLSANDIGSVRIYANQLATEQISMILEMQIMVGEIERDLGILGDIYESQAKSVLEIPVPPALAATHLEIVRNFSKAGAAFKAFGKEKEDPIILPVAVSVYQEATASQESILRSLAGYFRDNGIIFTSNEAGGYWNAFL